MTTTDATEPAAAADRSFGIGALGLIALVLSVLAITLLLVACGTGPSETTAAGVSPTDPTAAPIPSPEPLPAGRAVLEGAEGTPHVLWFWGAN